MVAHQTRPGHRESVIPERHLVQRHLSRTSGTSSLPEVAVEFFAADWTPWAAIATLHSRFSEVTVNVEVHYGSRR